MKAAGTIGGNGPASKAEERRAFLLLAVVLAPVLSVAIVGGYGFLVWMYQIVTGPPAG
jgi:periplasmic nitrate reductase NapE